MTANVSPTIGVVLVAAGRGERLGANVPKAFVELHGRPIIEFGIAVATSLPHRGVLVLVVPEAHASQALDLVTRVVPKGSLWNVSVVHGGRERHESVRFGLAALPDSVDTVLVHDAARPFASRELFERVIAEVHRTGDAVVPALPVADTLKRVSPDGIVHETVDRSPLVAVQTPQGFRREVLDAAHEHMSAVDSSSSGGIPTDDAEVVQRAGCTVRTVLGEFSAHKLTTPSDMHLLEYILSAHAVGLWEES